MTKYAMISQYMRKLTEEEIRAKRQPIIKKLEEMGYSVIDTVFTENDYNDFKEVDDEYIKSKPLMYLGQSLKVMSLCDAVYFMHVACIGRGCQIEYQAALNYGLEILGADMEPKWKSRKG